MGYSPPSFHQYHFNGEWNIVPSLLEMPKTIKYGTDHKLPPVPRLQNPELLNEKTLNAAKSKMAKIYKATDSNVEIQERTTNYGSTWQYRLYCSRCKTEDMIPNAKMFLEEVPTDETVIFCIKHRHNGKNNAMRVLSVFSDPHDDTVEIKGGRIFREDDE